MARAYLASQASVLNTRPLIVGTIFGQRGLSSQLQKAASPQIDVVELRLDSFHPAYGPLQQAASFSIQLIKRLRKKTRKPVLLTFRSPAEQGVVVSSAHRINDQKRADLLRRAVPFCQLVDLEIRRLSFTKDLTRFAHRHRVGVIHSYHEFGKTFRYSVGEKLSRVSLGLKGDLFKIAMNPQSDNDLGKFLSWGAGLSNPGRILIGMGRHGVLSRFLGYTFGSLLTYGHLGASAAPGQPPASELGAQIRRLYPKI